MCVCVCVCVCVYVWKREWERERELINCLLLIQKKTIFRTPHLIFLTNKAPVQYGLPLRSVFLNAGLQAGSQCASERSSDRPPPSRISFLQQMLSFTVCFPCSHPQNLLQNFRPSATLPALWKLRRIAVFQTHHSPRMPHFFALLHTANSRLPSTLPSSLPNARPCF